jgi:hypothetical protein
MNFILNIKRCRYLRFFSILLVSVLCSHLFCQLQEQHVTIDPSTVVHRMQGGIGASWHAMQQDIPLENEKYDYPVRMVNPRGSGYGGYPPLSDTAGWHQIMDHATWLGLDFIRVELSQRMYEPEREVFDWNNGEMQALYRILDWCETNHADVFLQQMWGHVEWNSYPGVHPLLSAPRSVDDFANGIASLLQHLTVTRKYTCIRYFCITNEPPGGTWGYWWSYGSGSGSVTGAWKKVRESLDARGIRVPLSGPDWTSLPPFDSTRIDFDRYVGAYDIHSYGGIDYDGENIIAGWANWAHEHKKPFFLSEFGNMNLGWGGSDPGPKSFAASLSNASDVVRCLNLGTDGFNRWSFINRGDLDGQWQLIRTWDIEKKEYVQPISPEPEAYYGFAMLTRFMGKYADMIFWQTNMCIDGVKLTAWRNRDNSIAVLFVNNEKRPIKEIISFEGQEDNLIFNLYQVTREKVVQPGFRLDPQPVDHPERQPRTIVLPPESISLITTLNLKQGDRGKIE